MSISINKKYSFEISINSPTILVRNHSQLDQLDYESSGHTGFASSDEFSSHIENTNNPHSVTKAQVGLEDVEDGAQINIIEKVNIDGTDLTPDVDKRITLPDKEPAFEKNTAFNKNFGNEDDTVCEGNDARLSDARTPLPHNHDDRYYTESEIDTALGLKVNTVEGETLTPNKYTNDEKSKLSSLDTQAELDIKFGAKEDIANKGVANGYAPLNASGIVDPIYVPSAYTDYVEYATYADLPATGVEGTLYVVIADETSGGNTSTYRWTGSVYVNVTDKLSASEVKVLYESNANTNAYTDDEKTKLSGIGLNAEVNILEGINVEGESDLAITDKKSTIPLATDAISGALDKVDKAYIDNVRDGTQSIPYDNTTSGLDSTTLNGAIDELNNIKLNSGIPYDRIIYMDENSVLRYIVPTRFEALTKTYNIKVDAGRFNMSWNNPTNRLWIFPTGTVLYADGTTPIETSTAEKPDVIIPSGGGFVKLTTSAWGGNYSLSDNNTDARLKTKLSDLPALTNTLSLYNCSLITGSLSDLPAVTYYLSLYNCSLITGSLSDLPALTYYLDLAGCSLITGALSDLPALTNTLSLYNCSLITGSLSDLPALTYYLDLASCSLITGALSDLPAVTYYLSLYNCSLITGSLSDLPALTNTLSLYNCSLITGSLSDLPALTNTLSLYNCSLITGSLSDLPALTNTLSLYNCSLITGSYTAVTGNSVPTTTTLTGTGLSATDMDNTLIAYAATTKNNGTFTATNKNRTAASDDAVATLVARGWTISGLIKI